jgi:hypothetical protein
LEIPGKGDEVVIYLDTRWGSDGGIAFDWGSLSPGTLLTDYGPKSRSLARLRHQGLWWNLNEASMSGVS